MVIAAGETDLSSVEPTRSARWKRLVGGLRPERVGALYVLAAVVVVFALWIPETFMTADTAKQVINDNAVFGLLALGLVVPLAAGLFDLSVGATLGLASMVSAKIFAETELGLGPVLMITVVLSALIGLANAAVVVRLRVDSFIATLATSALVSAAVVALSEGSTVSSPRLLGSVQQFATSTRAGISVAVLYVVVFGLVIWHVLENTTTGRKVYAVGFNAETARLAGVRVNALRTAALVVSSTIAGFAGVVVTGKSGVGSPTVGPPYLLPAFAIAFVGATQVRPGRFNAAGTLLAAVLIGTGSVGLALAQVPRWASDVYLGTVLILAISLAGWERRTGRR